MDSVLKKYYSQVSFPAGLFYLLIFFLPYLEVPFLEKIFVLKISNILAMLLGIYFLYDVLVRKNKPALPFAWIFSVFTLFALVSAFNGFRLPLDANLAGAVGKMAPGVYSFTVMFWMLFAVFIFWATVNVVSSRQVLCNAVKVHLVSSGIVCLYGIAAIIAYLMGVDIGLRFTELDWIVPRLSSTALEPLFFANYLLTAIPLGFMLYLTKSDILGEYAMLALLLIQCIAMLMTFSVGAWAALLAAVALAVILSKPRINPGRVLKIVIAFSVLAFIIFVSAAKTNSRLGLTTAVLSKIRNTVQGSTYAQAKEYYQAEFSGYDAIGQLKPGEYRCVKITVKNTGTRVWKAKGPNPVQLAYSWVSAEKPVRKNIIRIRTSLPRDIKPGEAVNLDSFIRAPEYEGKYSLRFDMQEEFVSSFQEQGRSLPLILDVNVSGPFQYYAADFIETGRLPEKIPPGVYHYIKVRVKNTGTLAWDCGGRTPVKLSYRWFNDEGAPFREDGSRASLPRDILPGESVTLTLEVIKPKLKDIAGYDNIRLDMVKELVVWFSEQDRTPMYHMKKYTPVQLNEYKPNVHTVLERWWLWRAGLKMFGEHPLLGVGPGNFSFLYNRYKPADAGYKTIFPVINNQYLEVLVETGILGALVFLIFIYNVFRIYLKGLKGIKDPFGSAIFIGLAACMLAASIQLNLFCGKSLNYLWVVFGLSVATVKLFIEE